MMSASTRDLSLSKAWFDRFVQELEAVAAADGTGQLLGSGFSWFNDQLKADVPEGWPEGTGWFADIGSVRGSTGLLSVWLDRYLDLNGDAHLSVWYEGTARSVRELADSLGVPQDCRYTWKHRDADGILLQQFARRERARSNQWIVDEWRPSESFLGMYVVPSPHLHEPKDVVGPVCGALRVIAQAIASPRKDQRENTSPGAFHSESERYWALIERLARPGQARFRKDLLVAFNSKCVITGCTDLVVLDAVHIKPVADFGNDVVGNGLVLRADLHRLFDAKLLTITAGREPRVVIARRLVHSKYRELLGAKLAVDLTADQRRSLASRNQHWTEDGLP